MTIVSQAKKLLIPLIYTQSRLVLIENQRLQGFKPYKHLQAILF
jgi:hypothetical protein